MSPYTMRDDAEAIGFPRSRGDEPALFQNSLYTGGFSPLTRG